MTKCSCVCVTHYSVLLYYYYFSLIQHVIGHHVYPNIEGADPDIDTGPEVCVLVHVHCGHLYRILY